MVQYDAFGKALNQRKSMSSNLNTRTVQQRPNNVAGIIQMAKINPRMLTQNDVMVLQRTMGNGAVCQLINGTLNEQNETAQKKDDELMNGLSVNDNVGVEKEAHVMGAKVFQRKPVNAVVIQKCNDKKSGKKLRKKPKKVSKKNAIEKKPKVNDNKDMVVDKKPTRAAINKIKWASAVKEHTEKRTDKPHCKSQNITGLELSTNFTPVGFSGLKEKLGKEAQQRSAYAKLALATASGEVKKKAGPEAQVATAMGKDGNLKFTMISTNTKQGNKALAAREKETLAEYHKRVTREYGVMARVDAIEAQDGYEADIEEATICASKKDPNFIRARKARHFVKTNADSLVVVPEGGTKHAEQENFDEAQKRKLYISAQHGGKCSCVSCAAAYAKAERSDLIGVNVGKLYLSKQSYVQAGLTPKDGALKLMDTTMEQLEPFKDKLHVDESSFGDHPDSEYDYSEPDSGSETDEAKEIVKKKAKKEKESDTEMELEEEKK